MITLKPAQVEAGMVSLRRKRPNNMLMSANIATYTPSNFKKSHFTILTATP